MTTDPLALVAAMPMPEPMHYEHREPRERYTADQLRSERIKAAELVLAELDAADFVPTNDFLGGHKCGLNWAAEVVEMDDPRTGDWMYDDRHDLAAAIRRGPEMPPAAPVLAQGEPVAEVMSGWTLVWVGREPLATICAAHPELRIGSKLYTRPAAPAAPVNAEMLAALKRLVRCHYSDGIKYSGDHPAAQARSAIASAEAAANGAA